MPKRTRLVLALCAGYFLVLLDVTIVNVALPQIAEVLSTGSAGLAWVVDAYAFPLAGLLLVAGWLGDRIGHRAIVTWGFVLFGLASVGCAVAPTLPLLVVARTVQGVGAALVLPGSLALLTELATDAKERVRLVGVWAALGGIALPAGPLLGGVLVETSGWRSVFWLSVPIIVLALFPLVTSSHAPRSVAADLAAPNLGTAASAGRDLNGTDAAHSAATSAHSAATSAPAPALATSRAALLAACAVAGLMNFSVLGALFLLTQHLQAPVASGGQVVHGVAHAAGGLGLPPLQAGLATLPAMVPLPLLGIVAGRLGGRLGMWRVSAIGLVLTAAGFAAMGLGWGSLPLLMLALALWGSGIGILTPAIVAAAMAAAPARPGLASGASNTARQAGGAAGVAMFALVTVGLGVGGPTVMVVCAGVFAAVGVACRMAAGRLAR